MVFKTLIVLNLHTWECTKYTPGLWRLQFGPQNESSTSSLFIDLTFGWFQIKSFQPPYLTFMFHSGKLGFLQKVWDREKKLCLLQITKKIIRIPFSCLWLIILFVENNIKNVITSTRTSYIYLKVVWVGLWLIDFYFIFKSISFSLIF